MTRGLSSVIALAIVSLASVASAQDRRAIVLGFSGPGSGAAEGAVRSAIDERDGWQAVDEGEVDRAASRLGREPGSREVAADVGASAVLDGRVTKRGRRFTLRVTVRDASTGSQLGEASFAGRGGSDMRDEIRQSLWDRVGSAIEQGRVPEGAAPTATPSRATTPVRVEETEVAEADEEEDDASSIEAPSAAAPASLSPLWIAAGVTGFSRDFSYTDDLFYALRPYQLPFGISARAAARWYPGAHFTSEFFANIGLDASIGGALGVRSRQRDGTTFPTESIDFRAGVDVRIPLAPVELGVGVAYGIHTYALGTAENGNAAQLPNVEYHFIRPSLRARADLGAGIYIEGAFGWRFLTASGALATWFPRSSGSGFDLGGYVGWESDIGLGARAGFEMQRYFFSMNPEPGDAYIAGGAVDQFLTGTLELVWRVR